MTADSNLPAPLVPADTDISGLPGFLLDVEKLFASELWALSTPEEFKAAVALWGRAWQQSPPGSLPNDDRILSRFSGAGSRWKKVREMALRGFVLCSDGKYYHKTLAADVLRAAESKRQRKARTLAATTAKTKTTDGDPGPEKPTKTTKHPDRNDDRNEHRYDLRHGAENGAARQTVTTTVTTSHRSNREGEEEREERNETPTLEPHPARATEPAVEGVPSRLVSGWNRKENVQRIEARLRDTSAGRSCLDPRVSPIAKLEAEGFDLENEIIPALIDIEAASKKPIRSWMLYAARARATILAERRLNTPEAETPEGIPAGTPTIRLGHLGDFAEPVLRRYVEAWRESPTCWFAFLGPKPGEPGCLIPTRLLDLVEAA